MRKYIGLENYDDTLSLLLELPNIDGIIIGDPFCSHKMFRYGEADMIDSAHKICLAGKEAVYQTPIYITSRNFDRISRLIEYFHDKCNIKKYLIQDIGLACWIQERYKDVELIWSHWGKNRNSLMNHDFINFLIGLGIAGIETDIPERMKKICNTGLPVYAVYGNTMYKTIARDCYNSYMLNRFDGTCKRECLSGEMSLCNKKMSITMNGYILGRKIHYSKYPEFTKAMIENTENVMIYACDYNSGLNAIDELEQSILSRNNDI